jgi:hypothetical protein
MDCQRRHHRRSLRPYHFRPGGVHCGGGGDGVFAVWLWRGLYELQMWVSGR